MGAKRFTELRAWQACVDYKRAVYRVLDQGALARDWERRAQLESSVAGPPAHIAEGFGRFSPADFARFVVMARSSLLESQNHLIDAVDRGRLSEDARHELDALAERALEQVTGLMKYLHSTEAARNARRARERRVANREARQQEVTTLELQSARTARSNVGDEPRTPNSEPRTEPEHELSTEHREPRTGVRGSEFGVHASTPTAHVTPVPPMPQ